MADFAKALKQGFEAVDVVWTARLEIEDVFARLSAAVLEVTDGKVRLELREASGLAALLPERGGDILEAVGANERKPLAVVRQSNAGYPVSVQPAGAKTGYVAGNREELEGALAELLKDVRIAERIKSLAAEPDEKG
jgi:hypothetical protein